MYTDMEFSKNNKVTKFDYKIILLLVIISFVIFYFLVLKDVFKDRHIKMEEEMVSLAKEYVIENNISTKKEIYLYTRKLNITLDDDCSFTSGVIYDGANYIPNLVCNDYKSIVNSSNNDVKDYITLKGEDVMILPKGISFYDPGYVSNDVISVIGKVGNEEGVYNLYYKPNNTNNFAVRKVIIIDSSEIRNYYPTIILNGDEILYLVAGNNYIDQGVTCLDTIDGNISNKVVIDGKVDINVPSEYVLTYVITNSRGYSNTITRKINVIEKDSDLLIDYSTSPHNLTNEDVDIKLIISDEFNKIIYPDGSVGKSLLYTVSENGTYKFSIYDIYDRIIEKEIVIDNIDKTVPEGTCKATLRYDKTEVNVNVTTDKYISSYEYIIDGVSSKNTQTSNYVSTKIKPSTIKVKMTDSIGNFNEITCSKEEQLTRKIVTNEKGKNCLEGLTCYIQFDYGDAGRYPYCSKANMPSSCGGIGRNGCSITSTTNAIAAMGVKSSKGTLHTPYSVWEELYPINKNTGECGGGCSAWSRMRDAIVNAGLSAPRSVEKLNKNTVPMLLEHLRKGYPAVVWADTGAYTSGKHYMSLLGVREDGYVYLSDSANREGTSKLYYNGRKYYVDTWVSTDDLISGGVKEFLLVGPIGLFEGK